MPQVLEEIKQTFKRRHLDPYLMGMLKTFILVAFEAAHEGIRRAPSFILCLNSCTTLDPIRLTTSPRPFSLESWLNGVLKAGQTNLLGSETLASMLTTATEIIQRLLIPAIMMP